MRTGRTLTVFRSLLFPGGVSGPGGVPAWSRGVCVWFRGVYLPGPGGCVWSRGGTCLVRGVCAWSGTPPPPVDRMTHACENITLAKTSFRPVIKNACYITVNVCSHVASSCPSRSKFTIASMVTDRLMRNPFCPSMIIWRRHAWAWRRYV